jgi:hypothetical protein
MSEKWTAVSTAVLTETHAPGILRVISVAANDATLKFSDILLGISIVAEIGNTCQLFIQHVICKLEV